jgi:hypothetical protein
VVEESPDSVPADVIQAGCSVTFVRKYEQRPGPTLGVPPFSLSAIWYCEDGVHSPLDEYEINGANPEVVTVLYWRRRDIVVLIKWSINSRAADYSGDYYKVFIYRGEKRSDGYGFSRDDRAMAVFGKGIDGVDRNGVEVHYAYKDAASIRKKLRTIPLGP